MAALRSAEEVWRAVAWYAAVWKSLIPAAEGAVRAGDAALWGEVLHRGFVALGALLGALGVDHRPSALAPEEAPLPPVEAVEARLAEVRTMWETEQALPAGEVPDAATDPLVPSLPVEELPALLDEPDDVSRETLDEPGTGEGAKTRVLGWLRVPQGAETCPQCLLIASRGHKALTGDFGDTMQLLFNSEETAKRALGHSACDCLHVPLYRGVRLGDDVKAVLRSADDVYEAAKESVTADDVRSQMETDRHELVAERAAAKAVRDLESWAPFAEYTEEQKAVAREKWAARARKRASSKKARTDRAFHAALAKRMREQATSASSSPSSPSP